LDQTIWAAALAPAGTPPAIVKKLNADIAKVASDPRLRKDLSDRGLEVQTMSPEELGAFMEKDYIKVREVVQALGIVLE
jgi:tripartite-type tricarboxylate transporter receptor subunit TctC